ncbi:hypothetical protein [Bradyrhizobium sp. USDA 4353]
MSVDAVTGVTGASAQPASADSDQAKFEEALQEMMPQLASFMLMPVIQDATQEMMEAGDQNANAPDPAG